MLQEPIFFSDVKRIRTILEALGHLDRVLVRGYGVAGAG